MALPDADEVVRTREGEAWRRHGRAWSLAGWARACRVRQGDRHALLIEMEEIDSAAFDADRDASGENVLASFSRGHLATSAPTGAPYRSAGETARGARFALFPWIEGGTLAPALARARGGVDRPADAVATAALEIARGLARTEALGALTPSSSIIDAEGVAWARGPLLDAIVKRMGGAPSNALPYTAPEVLRGEATAESRLFSLGVMIHDLLSGGALFPDGADGPRAIGRWSAPSVAHMPSAPEPLRHALWLLLQRNPTRRGTPRAIVDLLAPLYAPSPAHAVTWLGATRTPVPYFAP